MEVERSVILVKAWPQPSAKYGETVCCAGVTPEGQWRRLFPIRYRHLAGEKQFSRWDQVEYQPRIPAADRRPESRTVDESSLKKVGQMKPASRADFFNGLIMPSFAAAADRGDSLTLIRPDAFEFVWKKKPASEIDADKERRAKTLRQGSLFDQELAAIDPCPYDIRMKFTDAAGRHDMACGDWETAATFFKWGREYGEEAALEKLKARYEGEYADAGVVFALGTMAKHPKTWILLGIIRLDDSAQLKLI